MAPVSTRTELAAAAVRAVNAAALPTMTAEKAAVVEAGRMTELREQVAELRGDDLVHHLANSPAVAAA